MKQALPLLCLALLAACAAPSAQTPATPTPPPGQPTGQQSGICLPTYYIDHTTIPDDQTILFTMRDGKVWRNTLQHSCPGLAYQGGFTYAISYDEICANAVDIVVLQQNTRCKLGEFTPETAPKAR